MNLDDAQKQKVAEWIDAGLKLSEIQTRLIAEFGLKMTYMEVRFLVDDLKLVPKNLPPLAPTVVVAGAPKPSPADPGQPAAAAAPPLALSPEPVPEPAPAGLGGVKVVVDKLTRPGTVVSGKVTFSDGQTADWYLDQAGRLGLAAKQKGYRPSAIDVEDFQVALQTELAKQGF